MGEVTRTWAYSEHGVHHLPASERAVVPAKDVREWANANGLKVGLRGHLPIAVIDEFNRAHRFVKFVDTNPRSRKVLL